MFGPFHRVAALVIVAVLVLLVGVCAGGQMHSTPHPESSEACCAFGCSMLPIALLAFALWAAAAALRQAATPLVRSALEDPLSPPPEPLVCGSA